MNNINDIESLNNLKNIFNDILVNYCINTKSYYIFTYECFKKMKYNNYIEYIFKELKPYYYKKDQYYLERQQTYNTFTTIIRHFCKRLHYKYLSYIKYDKSTYSIIYNIYK